jgi:hypothetical protein
MRIIRGVTLKALGAAGLVLPGSLQAQRSPVEGVASIESQSPPGGFSLLSWGVILGCNFNPRFGGE